MSNNKKLLCIATLMNLFLALIYCLLLVIVIPNTHAAKIDRKDYVSILETSSFASANIKAKAGALVLFNGYEGSQFLLKWSEVFGLTFLAFSVFNSLLFFRSHRLGTDQKAAQ